MDTRERNMRVLASGSTDVGQIRQVNEDSIKLVNEHRLWILADGMGGHAAGQLASQMSVDEISHFLTATILKPNFKFPFDYEKQYTKEENLLKSAIRAANIRIYNRSLKEPQYQGMGTTTIAVQQVSENQILIGHVGDSRCYRFRKGIFEQLTMDHSLLNHLIYQMRMPPEEAKAKVGKNVIVRAVGLDDDVEVDLIKTQIEVDDLYLICSDGLSDLLTSQFIVQVLQHYGAHYPHCLDEVSKTLVYMANQAGGYDNISVILLYVVKA